MKNVHISMNVSLWYRFSCAVYSYFLEKIYCILPKTFWLCNTWCLMDQNAFFKADDILYQIHFLNKNSSNIF